MSAAALLLALVVALPAAAQSSPSSGTIRTDSFWSQSLGTRKTFVVWLPPSYDAASGRRYPVAYYLHGLWGDEGNWVRLGGLATTMDSLVRAGAPEMIVVMPDGDDSWYTTWNSLPRYGACLEEPPPERTDEPAERYCVPWPHYDDYIARDLVAFVDSSYRTIPDAAHRGIAGLSMGGYGAISLALAYPDVFGAAWSHSGVLAPMVLPDTTGRVREARTMDELRAARRGMWFSLGPAFGEDTAAWRARDPAVLAARAKASGRVPALGFDVGTSDALLAQNRAFDRALQRLGIAHDYAEYPGRHAWAYWKAHVAQSLAWLAGRIGR